MSLLKILSFPDPRLRKKALPIQEINQEIKQLASDMLETMYEASGVGLAATQINVQKRLVVVDVSDSRDQPMVFINPEILNTSEAMKSYDEGCLSVPGFNEKVDRPDQVVVRALGLDGKKFEIHCEGLLAVCIQHEIDHLNGKLFVDHISNLKRNLIAKKLQKRAREEDAS